MRGKQSALLGLSIVLASAVTLPAQESQWSGVSRVVALGDVHGSYDKMVTLLTGTGMVDGELRWIGGDQHLVFCGDLTDRGPNDRHVMDLAKRLQREAVAAGGRVHVVLGNHEIMNLTRDRRYWDADLLDEFAADETSEERQRALVEYRALRRVPAAREDGAFDDQFPPGYFARSRAFEPDGEYGAWLLGQPTVVKVNGTLFVHGGLTRRVADLGLDEINRRVTESVRKFIESADEMGAAVPFPGDMSAIAQGSSRQRASRRAGGGAGVRGRRAGLVSRHLGRERTARSAARGQRARATRRARPDDGPHGDP